MIPAVVKYKVEAETPEEAIELSKKTPLLEKPKLKINQMKRKRAKVFKWGTLLLELVKNLY